MIEVNKIQTLVVYDKDWHKEKLGKISASNFYKLISPNSNKGIFSETAKTYLEGLSGEGITGKSAEESFSNFDTEHGIINEPRAIEWVLNELGYVIVEIEGLRRIFIKNNEYSGCTPDALIAPSTPNSGYGYKMEDDKLIGIIADTLEVKCPTKHHRYIKLFKCDTPEQLKDVSKQYYWQVIFQMLCTKASRGHFGAFNDAFPIIGKVITFRVISPSIKEDLTFARLTLEKAIIELQKNISLFKKK